MNEWTNERKMWSDQGRETMVWGSKYKARIYVNKYYVFGFVLKKKITHTQTNPNTNLNEFKRK